MRSQWLCLSKPNRPAQGRMTQAGACGPRAGCLCAEAPGGPPNPRNAPQSPGARCPAPVWRSGQGLPEDRHLSLPLSFTHAQQWQERL